MSQPLYHTTQFARKASVSARTLRYYDKIGLFSPSQHSPTGYRLYTEADLGTLQQILALKYLGFSLLEIKGYLQAGPEELHIGLARQKAMLAEQRAQLDTIIQAIDRVTDSAPVDGCPWPALMQINEVMQMEQKNDWVNKYFTPEQRQKMAELS